MVATVRSSSRSPRTKVDIVGLTRNLSPRRNGAGSFGVESGGRRRPSAARERGRRRQIAPRIVSLTCGCFRSVWEQNGTRSPLGLAQMVHHEPGRPLPNVRLVRVRSPVQRPGTAHARGRLGARDRRAEAEPSGAALENQFRCCDCGPRADCSPSSISDGLLHSFDRARRATSPAPRSPRSRRRTPRPWACGTSFLFAAPADLGRHGPCRCRQGPQCLDPRARI